MGSAIFAKEIRPVVEMTGLIRFFEALREAANCYVLPSALGVSVTPSRACQRTRVKPNRVEGDGEGKPRG